MLYEILQQFVLLIINNNYIIEIDHIFKEESEF